MNGGNANPYPVFFCPYIAHGMEKIALAIDIFRNLIYNDFI